jgi:hypothetical protein
MRATDSPSVRRVASVAIALGKSLCAHTVFIGPAILPLLETERGILHAPRPADDVYGVIATTTYAQRARVEGELRARRFRHVAEPPMHLDRWRAPAPDDTIFDLVSCGPHLGGTGGMHDQWVITTAVTLELPPLVRHASAVGWLTLKCDAYRDRGRNAPLHSKDLADIVALCATRPLLLAEVADAPSQIRNAIGSVLKELMSTPMARSAVPSHIAERQPLVPDLADDVLIRLAALAALS